MITVFSYDSNSENKLTENMHVPSLSLLQLIHFNIVRQRGNLGTSCNTSAQETPISIYVAFLLNFQTRRRLLIGKFHDLGLYISYD